MYLNMARIDTSVHCSDVSDVKMKLDAHSNKAWSIVG